MNTLVAAMVQIVELTLETLNRVPDMPLAIAAMVILGGFFLATIVMFGRLAKYVITEQKSIVAGLHKAQTQNSERLQQVIARNDDKTHAEIQRMASSQRKMALVLSKQTRAMDAILSRLEHFNGAS